MPAGPTLRKSLSPHFTGMLKTYRLRGAANRKLEIAEVGQKSFHSFVSSERQLREVRRVATDVVQSQSPTWTLPHEPKSQNIGTLETMHITVKDSMCCPSTSVDPTRKGKHHSYDACDEFTA